MKTIDQIQTTPSLVSPRDLNTRTAVAALPPQRRKAVDKTAIRPFRFEAPEAELTELRRRIKATRWPEKETVADTSQGVPLGPLQDLARYWAMDYDWRKCEAKLNALPQFITEIDGLDIHFIHVRSKHKGALPVIISHGWPGSILEQIKLVGPLTDPTAFGGRAEDAFDVVIPSIPGYGFSGKPTTTGWDHARMARAWIVLMKRLGYTRYVAQGGDVGGQITDAMAVEASAELVGIHTNFLFALPQDVANAVQAGAPLPSDSTDQERCALTKLQGFFTKNAAYAIEMATRPQTLYGNADSPVALAAWLIDHGDGDDQPAATVLAAMRTPTKGQPAERLTRDDVLDNITLYWLTNTGVSSARSYWDNKPPYFGPKKFSIPAAFTVFPGEIYQPSRRWAERGYSNLSYFHEVDKGGHFAAWEEPLLFAAEMRAAFKSLRGDRKARDKNLHKQKASTKQNTNMKTQIKLTPIITPRRSRTAQAIAAAFALAAAIIPGLAADRSGSTSAANLSNEIHPFHVKVPEAQLIDLRKRINATVWPDKETVSDESEGVQLATMQNLARYWATEYDWRKIEAKLNSYPQFITEIDGLDIHFVHVRSKHKNALPIIITHGWPGSVVEQIKIIDALVNPTAYGGTAADAFDVVIPSMPGYGFSGKPTSPGWDTTRMARAWAVLMKRIGYTRYVAQGGDWGSFVTEQMGVQAPPGLLGIHINLPSAIPAEILSALPSHVPPPGLAADEKYAFERLDFFFVHGLSYALQMANHPQTLYGIADSPIGLAAWFLDHDLRSYQMITRAFEGKPEGLTRDDVLDNITLTWLTKTGISGARLYRENKLPFFVPMGITLPVAVSAFPDELFQLPRSWAERAYPNLIHYNKPPKGGHFAAWEQPELFTMELRAAFRSLRGDKATALNR